MGWRELPDKMTITHSVPDGSNLDKLLGALAGAINRHADAIAKPGDSLAQALRQGGIGETTNGQKLDAVIAMLQPLAGVPAELALIKEELSIIHGLIADLQPAPQPKPLEVRFVFKVANNHQDEPYSISIGTVTDEEGETLPNTDGLSVEVTSSDESVVAANFDPSTNSGVAHFGTSGVASLNAVVKNAKGDILGSGAADFTVTTGDPAAVSDVKIAFSGLTEEPTEPTP